MEPWEVYFELVKNWRLVSSTGAASHEEPKADPFVGIHENLIDHLVSERGWREEDAQDYAVHLFVGTGKAGPDAGAPSLPELRRRLKNAHADWVLSRRA